MIALLMGSDPEVMGSDPEVPALRLWGLTLRFLLDLTPSDAKSRTDPYCFAFADVVSTDQRIALVRPGSGQSTEEMGSDLIYFISSIQSDAHSQKQGP